jgi:hypothetical protein
VGTTGDQARPNTYTQQANSCHSPRTGGPFNAVVNRLHNNCAIAYEKRVRPIVHSGASSTRRPLKKAKIPLELNCNVFETRIRQSLGEKVRAIPDPIVATKRAFARKKNHVGRIVPGNIALDRAKLSEPQMVA